MITDLYLKATGKTALDNALQKAGLIDEETEALSSELVCIDRIGEISRVTGYDAKDEPIIEVIEGYHANIRLLFEPSAEQVEALYPVTILAPDEPVRVWA